MGDYPSVSVAIILLALVTIINAYKIMTAKNVFDIPQTYMTRLLNVLPIWLILYIFCSTFFI
jgi:dynactin complex subunit